jgi:fimbrial chaperone protein
MGRFLSVLALACAGMWSIGVLEARAAEFDVSPIKLTLSAKALSGTLVVSNRGDQPARFHVTAFAWEQGADGEMVLSPTKEIMFFPAMLTLNPQEARNLRVGVNVKPGNVERTFRVFVQELPALAAANAPNQTTVSMLVKMGIPVFIEPTVKPKPIPSISALSLQGNKFSFNVNNTGNSHFIPVKITVKPKDGSKPLAELDAGGWYVLAGRKDSYSVTLPTEACLALKSIVVEMQSHEGATMTATLENAHCTP